MKEITEKWLEDYKLKADTVLDNVFSSIYDTPTKNLAKIVLSLIKEIRRLKNQKQSGV